MQSQRTLSIAKAPLKDCKKDIPFTTVAHLGQAICPETANLPDLNVDFAVQVLVL